MNNIKTREMILIALFAALTSVGAYMIIVLPFTAVPFTMQILFVAFSGILLGAKNGMISQFIYMIIGLVGVPVFSGATGGIQSILKPTFGYVIGFVLFAFVTGYMINKIKKLTIPKIFLCIMVGLMVDYVIGVTYMYFVFNLYMGKEISYLTAINWGFTPFILFDTIKCLIVAVVASLLIPILKKQSLI